MLANRAEIPTECPPRARGKQRLCTLESLDGRTSAAKRASELAKGFEAEIGGTITASQRLAIDRAAALVALAEDAKARRLGGDIAVSLEDVVRTDNAAARAKKALPRGCAPRRRGSMKPLVAMRTALSDPDLLGLALAGASWLAWRVMLIAMMGEPLAADEREVFTRLTGRAQEPLRRVEELWGVIGRRGGKSRAAAILAVYIAALCEHDDSLAAGERGLVLCLAQNQRTAAVTFDYPAGIVEKQPLIAGLVTNRTADTLSLSSGIDLEVRPASFRGLRGLTAVAVIADDAAFWYTDESSANADFEILNAVRPSLATTGGPLVVISSPYAKRGELYGAYRRHYGPDGDPLILVAQGASRDFNPSLPQSVIDPAMERDAAAASAEFLGQFRSDIEAFISREVVDAATAPGRHELPPMSGTGYQAFVDPSGGSSDSMTLAIAHLDKAGRAVLDAVRERQPPFSPDDVVQEFAALLKAYGVRKVTGDRYGGEWPRERFRVHGIEYSPCETAKSDLYRDLLPLLNGGRVEFLDVPRIAAQLCGLERRTARSGKDSIDHGPGSHDDLANSVAGAIWLAGAASAPALWRSENFLTNGEPVPMPSRCNVVFAVFTVDRNGRAAVVYFSRGWTGPLLLVDYESPAPLSPQLLRSIPAKLDDLVQAVRARAAFLFAPAELADELQRQGCPAQTIDPGLLKDDGMLALKAATHIGSHRVKVCAEVLAKSERAPLGAVFDASGNDGDPLRLAALIGVSLALDSDVRVAA